LKKAYLNRKNIKGRSYFIAIIETNEEVIKKYVKSQSKKGGDRTGKI